MDTVKNKKKRQGVVFYTVKIITLFYVSKVCKDFNITGKIETLLDFCTYVIFFKKLSQKDAKKQNKKSSSDDGDGHDKVESVDIGEDEHAIEQVCKGKLFNDCNFFIVMDHR